MKLRGCNNHVLHLLPLNLMMQLMRHLRSKRNQFSTGTKILKMIDQSIQFSIESLSSKQHQNLQILFGKIDIFQVLTIKQESVELQ